MIWYYTININIACYLNAKILYQRYCILVYKKRAAYYLGIMIERKFYRKFGFLLYGLILYNSHYVQINYDYLHIYLDNENKLIIIKLMSFKDKTTRNEIMMLYRYVVQFYDYYTLKLMKP